MALYGQSKAIERKGISWIKQCSMLEYNNDIKGFSIVISAILSWQYPGSINRTASRNPPDNLQTLSNHLSIQYFNTQYTSNTQTWIFATKSNLFRCFFSLQVYVQGTGMGGYDVKSIDNDKNQIGIILIKWFFLSQLPRSVWRVSGRCLEVVWVTLDTVWKGGGASYW